MFIGSCSKSLISACTRCMALKNPTRTNLKILTPFGKVSYLFRYDRYHIFYFYYNQSVSHSVTQSVSQSDNRTMKNCRNALDFA